MAKRENTVSRVPIANMLGGVSRLPASLRAPNNVKDALNTTLHFGRGLEKRPGTEWIKAGATGNIDSGLVLSSQVRNSTDRHYHWVDRDGDERYLMVFSGDATVPVEIFNVTDSTNAIKCSVSYSGTSGVQADLKTYLSTKLDSLLKLRTITSEDSTFVLNQGVTTALTGSLITYQDGAPTPKNVELYASTRHRATVFGPPEGGAASGGFDQPPTGTGQNWYARISDGGFPSGWYQSDSLTVWPWYKRVRTPFANSEVNKATMPIIIRNTAKNAFEIQQINWTPRYSGNPAVNPPASIFGKKLTDISIHRGRLWLAAGEQLCSSRTNDLFNLWVDDYQLLRDDDPIDLTVGTGTVNIIRYLKSFAKALVIFTDNDQQFEVRGDPIISPTNVAIVPTTNYGQPACEPVTTNRHLYAPVTKGTASQIHEYWYDEQTANNLSTDIAAGIEGWIPPGIRQAQASKTGDILLFRSDFTPSLQNVEGYRNKLFLNHVLWSGNEKQLSAWCRWSFNAEIESMFIFGDWLYLLFTRTVTISGGTGFDSPQLWVERMRLRNLDNVFENDLTTELLFEPRLDRQYEIEMSSDTAIAEYEPDNVQTVLKLPFVDVLAKSGASNVMIKLDQFKAKTATTAGTLFKPTASDVSYVLVGGRLQTHVRIPGFYENGTRFIWGLPYACETVLHDVYLRDENNTPVVGNMQVKQLTVSHDDTTYIAVQVTPKGRQTLTWEYTGKILGDYTMNRTAVSDETSSNFKIMASGDHTTIKLVNDQPTPLRVSSMEFLVNFIPYKRSGAY
jgi:hypothetical protein